MKIGSRTQTMPIHRTLYVGSVFASFEISFVTFPTPLPLVFDGRVSQVFILSRWPLLESPQSRRSQGRPLPFISRMPPVILIYLLMNLALSRTRANYWNVAAIETRRRVFHWNCRAQAGATRFECESNWACVLAFASASSCRYKHQSYYSVGWCSDRYAGSCRQCCCLPISVFYRHWCRAREDVDRTPVKLEGGKRSLYSSRMRWCVINQP